MSDFILSAPKGANRKKRIVGRGSSSGQGTTAGRGNKGQQSRSGGGVPYVGFEGGQMPLFRRIARRGFSNYPFKKEYLVLNLCDIELKYADGETVNVSSLAQKGMINKKAHPLVKILANGELTKKLAVEVDKISASAKEKIEKAGGTVTLFSE